MSSVLSEVERIVFGERCDQYGDAEDSFQNIANYWNAYITNKTGEKCKLTPKDVALMMTLLKIAREQGPLTKRDNFVDAIGYLALGADMEG